MHPFVAAMALASVCAALSGCESTGPKVAEAPLGSLACRVGPEDAQHTVQVQAWRGPETRLSVYDTAGVCERLQQISEGLNAQGTRLRFELMGSVQTLTSLGPTEVTHTIRNPGDAHFLHLVVVDAISQCGSTRGYILGCTPRPGEGLVYMKGRKPLDNAADWVVWAHEMGHTVRLPHPDGQRPPTPPSTLPSRIMGYLITAQARDIAAHEIAPFNRLGQAVAGPSVEPGAALGLSPESAPPVRASELIPFVLSAGQHGLDLRALEGLDDTALLSLRLLLEPNAQIDHPWLRALSESRLEPVRINALVPLAELGREQAQAYVRDYLVRQRAGNSVDLLRYGLWALGRGQQRHPTPETRLFLQQAAQPGFWCATQRPDAGDCQSLAQAAGKAMDYAGIKPGSSKPSPAPTEGPAEPRLTPTR
jgi:hypothetical protein